MSKVKSDLIASFTSQFGYKVLGYIVLALLARHLAKPEFGALLFAMSLAEVVALFTELGTREMLVREVGADNETAAAKYGETLSARIPLVLVYMLFLVSFAVVVTPELLLVITMTGLWVALKSLSFSAFSVLVGLGRVKDTIWITGSRLLLMVALVLLVVSRDGGLYQILGAYLISWMYTFGLGFAVLRVSLGPLPLRWHLGRSLRLFRGTFLLFLLGALGVLHFKVDTVILGLLRPYAEVAAYEAGAKLLEASRFLVRPLWMIFLPICSALALSAGWPRLRTLFRQLLAGATVMGALIAVAVFLGATWIIPTVFGEGFRGSVGILQVLYLSVPSLFLATVGTFMGIALHIERQCVYILMAGVLLNVVLNITLIPSFGAMGAAWTTLVTQTLVAVGVCALVASALRSRTLGTA